MENLQDGPRAPLIDITMLNVAIRYRRVDQMRRLYQVRAGFVEAKKRSSQATRHRTSRKLKLLIYAYINVRLYWVPKSGVLSAYFPPFALKAKKVDLRLGGK